MNDIAKVGSESGLKGIACFAHSPEAGGVVDIIYGHQKTHEWLHSDGPGLGRAESGMTGYSGPRNGYFVLDCIPISNRPLPVGGIIGKIHEFSLKENGSGVEILATVAWQKAVADKEDLPQTESKRVSLGATLDRQKAHAWVDQANDWAKKTYSGK